MVIDYHNFIKRIRAAGLIHNPFEFYYGDDLPQVIYNIIVTLFELNDGERVYTVRHLYNTEKKEFFVVLTERGLYVNSLGKGPAIKWSMISEITSQNDAVIFVRNNRVLFKCYSCELLLPTNIPSKIIELLKPLASYTLNRDESCVKLSNTFSKCFAKYRVFHNPQDFVLVDNGKSAIDCIKDDYQDSYREALIQDDETMLLFRNATRCFGTEQTIITDKKFYCWSDNSFISFPWKNIHKVKSDQDKLQFVSHKGKIIVSLPHYNIVKKRAKLLESSEMNIEMAEQIADSFNEVLIEAKDDIKRIETTTYRLTHYTEAPSLKISIRPVCPKCGSVDYEYYYSEEYYKQEKKNKAKHWTKEIAGELLSYAFSRKPSPYSNYSPKVPDEVQCSCCGHIWKNTINK